MMKRREVFSTVAIMAVMFGLALCGHADEALADALAGPFDFSGERAAEPQTYLMQTEVFEMSLSGERTGSEVYRMRLDCEPLGGEDFEWTCRQFTVQSNNSPQVPVPALVGWSHRMTMAERGLDDRGQVFGIDHATFESLTDARGNDLSTQTCYFVYNAFIDFHSLITTFARPTEEGGGIQDLSRIGQRVVHASAFSEPPVNLGRSILEGSRFRNGEVTLQVNGLSLVGQHPCAIVGFDSGESAFRMIMQPAPNVRVTTDGSSHYWGDLYLDLESRWVRMADLTEVVVSETSIPGPPHRVNAVTERHLSIRLVEGD